MSEVPQVIDYHNCDLVDVEGEHPEFGNIRPRKIAWRITLDRDPIECIKSKSLRKQIKKTEENLGSANIVVKRINNLRQAEFQSWFSVYKNYILGKELGKLAIDENWYQKRAAKIKIAGVFVYKEKRLIGGNLCIQGLNKLNVGYGVVERQNKLPGLGAYVDYQSLLAAQDLGYKTVSFGQDTNLYGHHLTSGLFAYKVRFGLIPQPVEKFGYVTTRFVSFEKFSDPVLFLAKENDDLVVNLIYKGKEPLQNEYLPQGITKVITRSRREVITKNPYR